MQTMDNVIKAQDRNEWTAIKREARVKLKGP
jgi:hypothetical protein